ncbi:MAG TPA: ThuA domain-containing protein [Chitinophagaceae bacterium]|jgi:type 1 glutamine amidotransferase|nr:ThuA domain-containing protein [Chitinophagaceae bacterium]
MKRVNYFLPAILLALFIQPVVRKKPSVLVFSKTAGYHHASIKNGQLAIMQLGNENGFNVDTSSDASLFTKKGLSKYKAVIFLSTTGDVLNNEQQTAFEEYIRSGKGFMGIHGATDTEYEWPWYAKLVGAQFSDHPKQQEAKLLIADNTHASTSHLPATWQRKDEWYNFKNINPDIHVVMTVDEKSYSGGKNGDNHPMAWYHEYDGGRSFYTAIGHTEESYTDPAFIKHLLGGIQYAIGNKQ